MNLTNESPKILVVDDDENSLAIVELALQKQNYLTKAIRDGEQALSAIIQWEPQLVILDINMPGLDGYDLLKRIRLKSKYISVIFLSGLGDPQDIVQGLDAGADDYITKPFKIEELLARVRAQLRNKTLQDQLFDANIKLKQLVDIDDLTGLHNMRSLYERLDKEISRCRRFSGHVAVIMMDMDHFKSVNDNNDHLFGSYVLSEVGGLVRANVRKFDHAARYGGDEFIIILSEVELRGAIIFCERLRKSVQDHPMINGKNYAELTCSLGLAIISQNEASIDAISLVKMADKALYEAKAKGRNCLCYYDLSIPNQTLSIKVDEVENSVTEKTTVGTKRKRD